MSEAQYQKALFLDRDGVINTDIPYVHEIGEIEFMDGIFDFCRAAKGEGYLIIIVTNQAGIGHGYYSKDDFHCLMEWMLDIFKNQSVVIDYVFLLPSSRRRNCTKL